MANHGAILLVHHRPDQVAWLIGRLEAQRVEVVVHVDAKARALLADTERHFRGTRGVHFLQDTVSVNWGGLSQVHATLKGVRHLMYRVSDRRIDHVHLLSGECLPLVPFSDIDRQITALPLETDLIDTGPCDGYEWRVNRFNILGEHPKNRTYYYDRLFCRLRDLQKPMPVRNNFPVQDLRKGSQWWSLSRTSLERMLSLGIADWLRRFRWTRCSDEHFFQMLHLKAGLHAAGNRRFIDFPAGASSPRMLSIEELQMARFNGYLFARKIDLDVGQAYIK